MLGLAGLFGGGGEEDFGGGPLPGRAGQGEHPAKLSGEAMDHR